MTYREAVRDFRREFIDLWERGVDYWTVQQAWACYTDCLCKDGQITDKQYMNWSTPFTYGKRLKVRKVFSR